MPQSTHRRDEQQWLATVSLIVLAVIATAAALAYTRGVMIPFVLAVFITTIVSPLVDFQVLRWKLPPAVAISTAILVVLVLMAVLSLLLIGAIQTMVATAGDYSDYFESLSERVLSYMDERGIQVDHVKVASEVAGRLPSIVTHTVGTATGLLSNGFLILIFVVFMLAGRRSEAAASGVYAQIEATIRRYISTKFVLSAITGILVWVILRMFGLKMASMFGMLAFLLNFIPSVGSVIATLLPIPVAVAQFDSFWTVLAVVAVPGAVQMAVGNVIEPKIMGEGLKPHPVTILLALAFWGLLWGPIGMVLAAPIAATIRIILLQFDTTRPVAELLAGKLPEPHESQEDPDHGDGNAARPTA